MACWNRCKRVIKWRLADYLGVNGCIIGSMIRTDPLLITPEILGLIAGIDEFKGAWRALGTLAPDRLSALRRVATIESIGSSTRIEGNRLSDREVERLLSNLQIRSFETRDEQEVAGYAEEIGRASGRERGGQYVEITGGAG